MSHPAVLRHFALGFPWQTHDPFLFCAYHLDQYPSGTDTLGPTPALLNGRELGQDFTIRDGWRMYHGQRVPGFPAHPHRGFETVTVVRQGWIDHADSLGAAGRYSAGDVQWMTAGRGVQHAEMFPLLSQTHDNPTELFQIWLNLPRARKMVEPHFKMLWAEQRPVYTTTDSDGHAIRIELVAGSLAGLQPPAPPPESWAADPAHQVAIWVITLAAGAQWELPAAGAGLSRTLYFYRGGQLKAGGLSVEAGTGLALRSEQPLPLQALAAPAELLLLQGQPLGEPVVQYGPFVMNSQAEIFTAFADYQRDQFGGWPWPGSDPVHGSTAERFAQFPDGRREAPPS